MTASSSSATPSRPLDTDVVLPFQLDSSALRGRLVRLGPALDDILHRHAYPAPVAALLGETLTLAVALAAALKYDGIFTLQTKGDGAVSLMVADVTSAGDVRAYAQFDAERLARLTAAGWSGVALLGKGYLAFTVDQGEHTERYQGIVELYGRSMAECVQHYFRQSEQLQTTIRVAVGTSTTGDQPPAWCGGALMLQRMPGPATAAGDAAAENAAEDWNRAQTLMATVTDAELLDPALSGRDLLYRLFHEEGVRGHAPQPVRFGCRCSRERVATVLRSLPREDLEHLKVDGEVAATCEFCNTTYRFDDQQVARLFAP